MKEPKTSMRTSLKKANKKPRSASQMCFSDRKGHKKQAAVYYRLLPILCAKNQKI